MQTHWKSHLHFIPNKCDSHSEEFVDAVCDIRSISIDRFQRWREVGYLGNPANFSGTYISYLAHEALYFNYEFGALYEPDEEYDEITIFEREHYTGGWAATISQLYLDDGEYELSCQYAQDICEDLECTSGNALEVIECIETDL